MALIIPEGSLTASYPSPQLVKCLSQLPDTITVHQQFTNSNHNLRYLITKGKRSVLIATLPSESIQTNTEMTGQSLRRIPALFELINERNALLPLLMQDHAQHLLPIILLLPEALESNQTIRLKDQGLIAIGDILLTNVLEKVINHSFGMSSSDKVRQFIRTKFCPEIIIDNNTKPQSILSKEQEKGLKSGLISTNSHSTKLLIGVAGSGKSTILSKRAALIHSLNPTARILVLSYNKAINNNLKEHVTELTGKSSNIDFHPFMEWCRKLLGGTRQFVYDDQESDLFDQMLKRYFPDGEINRHSLVREINFIKNHALSSETEYLDSLAMSSSYALPNPIRKRIWQTSIEVDTHLKDRKRYLWSSAPKILLEELGNGKIFEPYTHILIDETQYFAPIWVKLIQRVMATNNSQLFLVADSAHNFSESILNWHKTGIELRGNTTRLSHTYRCSPKVCKVADGFRISRSLQTLSNPITPIEDDIADNSPQPRLLQFPSTKEQKLRLFSEIHQLITQNTPPKEILILCASKQSSRLLAQEIKRETHIAASAITGSMIMSEDSIRVCDIESASGLQSQVVFIIGIEELIAKESHPNANAHDRRSLKTEHTQLLHMAMTRASKYLYLLVAAEEIPEEWQVEGLFTPALQKEQRASVTYLKDAASAQ